MRDQLSDQAHAGYHEGLEVLGKCIGATPLRTTAAGAPDVVWSFPGDAHIAFEAKTEKKVDGKLSKKDLQEAKGHIDWVRSKVADDPKTAIIDPIVVSPDRAVHEIGEPFKGGIFHLRPQQILEFATFVADRMLELRVKYRGRDYASAQKELSVDIRAMKLDMKATATFLKQAPLDK
jgi:hypothetical protein